MIIIRVTLQIKPGMRNQALDEIRQLVSVTQTEPGVIAYEISIDINDPDKLQAIEIWQDEPSLLAHAKTEHSRAFFKTTMPLLDLGKVESFSGEMQIYENPATFLQDNFQ